MVICSESSSERVGGLGGAAAYKEQEDKVKININSSYSLLFTPERGKSELFLQYHWSQTDISDLIEPSYCCECLPAGASRAALLSLLTKKVIILGSPSTVHLL